MSQYPDVQMCALSKGTGDSLVLVAQFMAASLFHFRSSPDGSVIFFFFFHVMP